MNLTALIKTCCILISLIFSLHPIVVDVSAAELDKIDNNKNTLAVNLIELMNTEQFAQATKQFDTKLHAALPSEQLTQVWQQLNAQAGSLQSILDTSQRVSDQHVTVVAATQFQYALIDISVAFDKNNHVTGLFFSPSKYKPKAEENDPLIESIQFGDKDWLLNGEITYPENINNPPLVILVHGSGPNDMDLTIGPNKPFLDIAKFLAQQGIATLRYNKRTYEHSNQYAKNPVAVSTLTLTSETVDDAVYAYHFAKTLQTININKIFIGGLSQGGMAIPRIAQRTQAAGYVMLAAPARGLDELTAEQYQYISGLDGEVSHDEQQLIDSLAIQRKNLTKLHKNSAHSSKDLPLGLSKTYWLDLMAYDAVQEAQNIQQPLLIIQGGRDYQVLAKKDFLIWKNNFSDSSHVTLKLFPQLNHLMHAGDSPSTPHEYYTKNTVDEEFMLTLSQWIKGH